MQEKKRLCFSTLSIGLISKPLGVLQDLPAHHTPLPLPAFWQLLVIVIYIFVKPNVVINGFGHVNQTFG